MELDREFEYSGGEFLRDSVKSPGVGVWGLGGKEMGSDERSMFGLEEKSVFASEGLVVSEERFVVG